MSMSSIPYMHPLGWLAGNVRDVSLVVVFVKNNTYSSRQWQQNLN